MTNQMNSPYYPEELSAILIEKMKDIAEKRVNEKMKAETNKEKKITIQKAVVTVPAYFNKAQKQATSDACKIAGIECLRVISEPTAASLAYAMKQDDLTNGNHYVLVYDLGGGTLDISVLNITDLNIEVMATNGDT